ncbi:serine/threonine-protein kinase [Streptomyces pseudovenezuelae]|uniref:serine/threonine-protein kinase n=1 Tax=Streptomyces pseudovenezuelae TaxID=67350 RepID=UPI002E3767E6|nr:serine/threonine-protein kinase [Streptomyces pseudovenezuelae]
MTRRIRGHYELIDRLGRGGMGEVWSARDLRLDRPVAVKFLSAGGRGVDLDRMEQRFLREARLTARIRHASVPVVYDSGRLDRGDGDGLYLVMELVQGDTLSRLLKRNGPFPIHLAAEVAAQAADALAHAHRIGVVHRDLKPSNLMLTPNGTVKVLDFGIAAALEPDAGEPRLTRTQEVLGTPGFIAPEQADGGRATERSDLYALGCVLYEILAGRPPFTAGTAVTLLYRHAYEEPPRLGDLRGDIPAGFASLIMELLAKSPDDRPSTEEVRSAAHAWLTRSPGRAVPGRTSATSGSTSTKPGSAAATGSGALRSASVSASPPAGRSLSGAIPAPRPAPTADPAQAAAVLQEILDQAARGDHAAAAASLERMLHETGRPLGDSETVAARLTLCDLLVKSEEFTSAHGGYSALGDALRRSRPATDPDVLACRAGAATCLAELGRTTEALHEFESLLPVQRTAFGAADRGVLETRFWIGMLVARMGRLREAHDQLTALRQEQQRIFPADDERHARTDSLIARLEWMLTDSERGS